MNNLLDRNLTMSSMDIAIITGKEHKAILRDIRTMLVNLYGTFEVPEGTSASVFIQQNLSDLSDGILDGANLYHEQKQEFTVNRDVRGYVTGIDLNYNLTMTLISGYEVKLRKAIIDRWQN